MNVRWMVVGCALASLAGCAGNPMVELPAGPVTVGALQLDADAGWNAGGNKLLWTQDGPRLDALLIYADIHDGEPLEKKAPKQAAYPPFRSNMLPNEIVAVVESTLTKVFGEGAAVVTSSGLKPQNFGSHKGFAFELAVAAAHGPDYRGIVGGFVANGTLQIVVYLGAVPYYFDLRRDSAARVIASARLAAGS